MFTTLKQTSIAVATITALTLGGDFATSTTAEAAGFAPSLSTANIVESVETENYIIVAKAKGGKSSFKGGRNLNRGSISKSNRGVSRNRVTGRGRNITSRRDVQGNRGGRVTSRNSGLKVSPSTGIKPSVNKAIRDNFKPAKPGVKVPPGGLVVNTCPVGNCTGKRPHKGKKRIKRGIYIQANTRHCHKKIRKHRHVHKHSKRAHIHAQGCKTYRVQP